MQKRRKEHQFSAVLIFLWLSLTSAVQLIFCLPEGIRVMVRGRYLCPETQVLQMNQIIIGTIVINECLVLSLKSKTQVTWLYLCTLCVVSCGFLGKGFNSVSQVEGFCFGPPFPRKNVLRWIFCLFLIQDLPYKPPEMPPR